MEQRTTCPCSGMAPAQVFHLLPVRAHWVLFHHGYAQQCTPGDCARVPLATAAAGPIGCNELLHSLMAHIYCFCIRAGSQPDWEGGRGYLAFSLSDGGSRALFLAMSASGGTEGTSLPPPPAGTSWHAVVDTGTVEPLSLRHYMIACCNQPCTFLCLPVFACASPDIVMTAGRPTPYDAAADGGVQLSSPDYYLQPKSALVLEAVPYPQGPRGPTGGSAPTTAPSAG